MEPAIIIFILIIVFSCLSKYLNNLSCFIKRFFIRSSPEELELRKEFKSMKEELQTIRARDDFARYAKLERKIIKHKSQIQTFVDSRLSKSTKASLIINISFHFIKGLTFCIIILYFRNVPILNLNPQWLYPFNKIISFPTGIDGAIGVKIWMISSYMIVEELFSFLSFKNAVPILNEHS